jgi:hypothetical protein
VLVIETEEGSIAGRRRGRKLHKEELRNCYSSPSIISYQIKENDIGGTCSANGEEDMLIGYW